MRILMLRHSAGFEHSYLPDAEVTVKRLALKNGWQATTTHRCENITAASLEKADVLVFATTGELPFDAAQKAAILGFVRDGKGFFGIHNATDTCYQWAEYGQMIGGYFNGHPWTQEVGVIVEDRHHPATCMLPEKFRVFDEIYTMKNWARDQTHVLLRLDNSTVDLSKGTRADHDYALAWCHAYGRGRVMYTALGHPDELWHQPWFWGHIEGCLKWAGGLA